MQPEQASTEKNSKPQYKELRRLLMELSQNGQLLSNVRLDQCTVVVNAEMFIDSHMKYLDHIQRVSDSGKRFNYNIVKPYFERLLKYYEIISKKE